MSYLDDPRNATVAKLATIEKDKKRVYSDELLQGIEYGALYILNEISIVDRNNRDFMEPLLFAVKNHSKFGTYEVFKYYGEELQKQELTMATEIVSKEPETMEDTIYSKDAKLALYFAQIKPEFVLYISDDLINDGEFIEDLLETCGKEAIQYAIEECNIEQVLQDNPELANNPDFMKEAIKEDASILQHTNEQFKNDYEFMRDVTKSNREAIDYVVEHTDEFGEQALNATRISLVEHFTKDVDEKISIEMQKLKDEKIESGRENEIESEQKNVEEIKLERIQGVKERAVERYNRYVSEVEEGTRKPEDLVRFINRYMQAALPEDLKGMMNQTKKLWEAEIKRREEKIETKSNETNAVKLANIEERAEGVKLDEIHTETGVIRETITRQLEEEKMNKNSNEQQEKTEEEIGELGEK